MKCTRIILISIVAIGLGMIYHLLSSPKYDPVLKLDSTKEPVNSIIFKSTVGNTVIHTEKTGEIKKIVRYLNTINYKNITLNSLKETSDYVLLLRRSSSNSDIRLEFNDKYIFIYDESPRYYESNMDLIAELKRLHDNYKQ